MTTEELYDKLKLIQKMKCETQNLGKRKIIRRIVLP